MWIHSFVPFFLNSTYRDIKEPFETKVLPAASFCACKGKYKWKIRGLLLSVENKRRLSPSLFLGHWLRQRVIVSCSSVSLKYMQIFLKLNKPLASFMTRSVFLEDPGTICLNHQPWERWSLYLPVSLGGQEPLSCKTASNPKGARSWFSLWMKPVN